MNHLENHANAQARRGPASPRSAASVWRSQGGSLYLFDGDGFTCIAVHSKAFHGWIGKRRSKTSGEAATSAVDYKHFATRSPATSADGRRSCCTLIRT